MKIFRIYLLLFLVVCVFNLTSCSDNPNSNAATSATIMPSKTANISSNESAYLYYCPSPESGIVKIKSDGTDKTQILSNGVIDILTINNGWIYYLSVDDNYLYKIKTDGSEKQKISGNINCSKLYIVKNYLYFLNVKDTKIYKIKEDGKNIQKLYDNKVCNIVVFNNTIYFTTLDSIFSMNTNAKDLKNLNIKGISDFDVSDSYIFYIKTSVANKPENIYKFNIANSENNLFAKSSPYFVLGTNKIIYSDSDTLHIADFSGKNDKIIYKGKGICPVRLVDDVAYFQEGNTNGFSNGSFYSINSNGYNLKKLPSISYKADGIGLYFNS